MNKLLSILFLFWTQSVFPSGSTGGGGGAGTSLGGSQQIKFEKIGETRKSLRDKVVRKKKIDDKWWEEEIPKESNKTKDNSKK